MASPAPPKPAKTAVKLRISLMEHTPTIWRRLLVPGEIKLSKLHLIFQVAMGWENYHLHAFEIAGQRYGAADPEWEMNEIDEETVAMVDVVTERARFFYEYDFGDSWRHEVVVESIEPAKPVLKHAVCLEGQRACPPRTAEGPGATPPCSRRSPIPSTKSTTSTSNGPVRTSTPRPSISRP